MVDPRSLLWPTSRASNVEPVPEGMSRITRWRTDLTWLPRLSFQSLSNGWQFSLVAGWRDEGSSPSVAACGFVKSRSPSSPPHGCYPKPFSFVLFRTKLANECLKHKPNNISCGFRYGNWFPRQPGNSLVPEGKLHVTCLDFCRFYRTEVSPSEVRPAGL